MKKAFRVDLARMFRELQSRDREDGRACPPSRACAFRRGGRATWQSRGSAGLEALTLSRRASELVLSGAEGRTEDAKKDGRIHGRSHALFMKSPG